MWPSQGAGHLAVRAIGLRLFFVLVAALGAGLAAGCDLGGETAPTPNIRATIRAAAAVTLPTPTPTAFRVSSTISPAWVQKMMRTQSTLLGLREPSSESLPDPGTLPGAATGTVVRIVDATTFDVVFPDGSTETLRLTGVDKPWAGETGEDGPGIACLYDWTTHAAEFVGWMLLSRTVTVVLDGNRTAAGTLLGRIYVNGDDFAAGLVQIGLARVDADAKADQEGYYRRLENEARARKLGLSPNSGQDTARPPFRGDRGSFWPVHDGIEVRVVRAIDGSTIEVAFQDGTTTTVGFLGVQVPAAGAEGSCLARWRELGAEYVRALLSRQTVTIIVEPHRRGVDPYPGLLAYVHLRGRDLGAALVEQGYASVSSRPRSGREDESLEIQDRARAKGLGLWQCRS